MAPKLSKSNTMASPHAAGIYADMTVDGPDIGTLVVVVDRAKNLPNLRTMGKQDPYCALRLGKEAKKTETDKRGGQTPKWDQELRFTVHDSLDYHKIKVSVFNDDRKTDLIGESFISLDGVLQIGGGQEDAWHDLHCRGRFAGQIRLEFTYYDTRTPSAQSHETVEAENQAEFDLYQQQQQHTLGPRQPHSLPRRPVPGSSEPSPSHSSAPHTPTFIPLPQTAPRSYHTPPSGSPSPYHHESSEGRSYQVSPSQYAASSQTQPFSVRSRSLPDPAMQNFPMNSGSGSNRPNIHAHDSEPWSDNGIHYEPQSTYGEYDGAFTDGGQFGPDTNGAGFVNPESAYPGPLRHERVQTLANGRRQSRQLPQKPALPHANSAPIMGHELTQGFNRPDQRSFARYMEHPYDDDFSVHEQAPLPPTHRNSAPAVGMSQERPLPLPYAGHQKRQLENFQGSHSSPLVPQTRRDTFPERRRSGDAMISPDNHFSNQGFSPNCGVPANNGGAFDTRHSMGNLPTMYNAVSANSNVNTMHHRPRPASHMDQIPSNPIDARDIPPLRPRAISPTRGNQASSHPSTPGINRKAISGHTSPNHSSPSMPYSPDSYDAYNPHSSQPTPPSSINNKEPSPMYHSPPLPPRGRGYPARQNPAPSDERMDSSPPVPAVGSYQIDPNSPIVNAKGRVVDPRDHLPASSYAPEPEPKPGDVKRASINAAMASRFGPRDARQLPTTTRSLPTTPAQTPPEDKSGRSRLQKRLPNGSSPLAPSPPHALNANYNIQPVPPPIPSKIPFDTYDCPQDDMHGLAQNMTHMQFNQKASPGGIGPSPLQRIEAAGAGGERYYGNGRGPRSRFGA